MPRNHANTALSTKYTDNPRFFPFAHTRPNVALFYCSGIVHSHLTIYETEIFDAPDSACGGYQAICSSL